MTLISKTMPRKRTKKTAKKDGTINSVERAIERMNAQALLDYAKKVNAKRRIKLLKKDTHTGETIVEIIEPSKIKSKTI